MFLGYRASMIIGVYRSEQNNYLELYLEACKKSPGRLDQAYLVEHHVFHSNQPHAYGKTTSGIQAQEPFCGAGDTGHSIQPS